MPVFDDLTRSIRDIARRIAVDGKRTAALTRLRMELTGLDRRRKELYARLGAQVDELRRAGKLLDASLLKLLEGEFENIDRVEKSIRDTMDQIQQVNVEEIVWEEDASEGPGREPTSRPGDLLDSFEVL